MSLPFKRLTAWVFTLALVTLAWTAAPASAYWTASGSGSGGETTDTFNAAVIDAPSGSTGSVTISWSAEAGLDDDPTIGPVTYVVQRALGAGTYANIASGGCAGTFTRPATGSTPSCTDTASTGSYSYRVVATLATWTAISNAVAVSVNTDTTVPTVTSVNRYSPSTTATNSTTTVQFRATFSEAVKGVDATDFALVSTGGVGGASIASVSPSVTSSATIFTITVNVGTGEGTLGLNLVDDDSIVDGAGNKLGGTGAGNGNATGQVYTVDRTAPTMTSVAMYDATTVNGKVDQVRIVFNETLSSSTLKTNWTLTNCPSGCSISSVSVSSKTVTIKLTEGTGPADTAVNGFTVALAAVATTGIRDVANNPASFAATAPQDLAKPQLMTITDTDGATDGLLETGDTITFGFSEPIAPASLPSSSTISEARAATGNVKLSAASVLYTSYDMGSTDYINTAGKTATFASTPGTSGSGVVLTVGACTANCANVSAPAAASTTAAMRPYGSLTDLAGNTAGTLTTATFTGKLF